MEKHHKRSKAVAAEGQEQVVFQGGAEQGAAVYSQGLGIMLVAPQAVTDGGN